MPDGPLADGQGQRGADRSAPRWIHSFALAALVGLVLFLLAKLGLGLPSSSDFVAVFWPAMGFGAGVLIGLGPSARWPVLAAITVANFLANLSSGAPPQIAAALCLAEATECLVPALLVERWFGPEFNLARLRHVLGLLAAAAFGAAAGWVCWIVASRLFYGPTGPILTTFQHWFLSDMIGFITLGPFVLGLFAAWRQLPPQREILEGLVALLALAMVTGTIILLPSWFWETALPIAWLFPILLWLAARCRPIFAAAAAFLVSTTVVSTTVFGIGHFGDVTVPIDDRILQAQTAVLFVALGALVLAALFSERRESETRLARANMALERERKNRLMNIKAATSSIVHEIRQPLAAITTAAIAARRWLEKVPPDVGEVKASLENIERAGFRASEILANVPSLFQDADHEQQPIDVNNMTLEALQILNRQMNDHGVKTDVELASELPLVMGHKVQLQEVISNLVNNAIDAMAPIKDERRTLKVRTKLEGAKAVIIELMRLRLRPTRRVDRWV